MKRFIVLLLLITLIACNERVVQLPTTTNSEITEVLDVSPIYIFYNEDTGAADFNRSNMIGTTNWLVNIDKRLTLKQVLPHLQYLQEKRNKDSMHKNDEARNYYTCSNLEIENLAFIDFTELVYINGDSQDFTKNLITNESGDIITLKIDSLKSISIINSEGKELVEKDISFITNYLEELESNHQVTINLYEDISFQDYIAFKSNLLEIKNKKLELVNKEFIYN